MSKSVFTRSVSAVFIAALLTSTAAVAAPLGIAAAAGTPAAQTQATPVQMRGGHMAGHGRQMGGVDRVEGRIAFLKAELKITDAQAGQWETVAKAMRDQSAALKALRDQRPQRDKAERDKAERRALTAPEVLTRRDQALDQAAKALAVRTEGQKQFAAAFVPLYNQMSDEQKKTADSLLTQHGRGHRR